MKYSIVMCEANNNEIKNRKIYNKALFSIVNQFLSYFYLTARPYCRGGEYGSYFCAQIGSD